MIPAIPHMSVIHRDFLTVLMDPVGPLTIHWPDSMDSNEALFLHQNTLIPSCLSQHESTGRIDHERGLPLSRNRARFKRDTAEQPAPAGLFHERFVLCRVFGRSYERIAFSVPRSPSLDRDLALNQRGSLVAGFQARR